MKKLIALAMAFVLIMSILAGCSPKSPGTSGSTGNENGQGSGESSGKQVVKVGVMTALSGQSVRMGEIVKASIETAYKHIQEDDFLKDYELQFDYVDDKMDTAEAITAANYVINTSKSHVAIGHILTTMNLASGSFFEEAQIPVIGIISGPAATEQGWEYTFRCTGTDYAGADTLMEYLVQEKGFEKIAIIHVNTEGGVSGANRAEEKLAEYGIKLVAREQFTQNDPDFSGQVLRMKEAGAEAVVFWGGGQPDANITLQQIRQLWGKVPEEVYFTGATLLGQSQMIEVAGKENIEGISFYTGFIPNLENEQHVRFMNDYKAIDPEKQDPADVAARVYDAIYIIANALNDMGSYDVNADDFSVKLRDAIDNTSFTGVQGEFDFSVTHNGDGLGKLNVAEWQGDGTYKKIYPLD